MTDSLADRLRAAIDETERIAQAAGGTWALEGDRDELLLSFGKHTTSEIGFCEDDVLRPAEARHIVRHDPAAVLRRCAADRKLLDWLVMCEDKALDNNWWSLDVNVAIEALAEAYGVEA